MTTVHATGYSAISSYSRVELMHLLQQQSPRTIAEMTAATGLHANTVREHLQRLLDEGYVVAATERRTTRGRPRVLYSAADGAAASSPVQRRRVRAAAERGDLMRRVMPTSGPEALETDALHQLDAIVDDLVDAGFDPIIDESDLSIELTPCHQAQAQADHLEVLCQVHVSIMQGVLTEAGGPLRVEGIRPSCDPTECVVLLRHTGRTES